MHVRGSCRLSAIVLAMAVVSCGQTDAGQTSAKGPGLRDPGSDDFAYASRPFDRGSRSERMSLLRRFRAVQKDFFAGRARAVCASFDRDRTEFDAASCVGQVRRTAAAVAGGDVRWPVRRVLWVRIYEDASGYEAVGGITVTPELRVGFVKRDGRWRSSFAVPGELSGLSTRLTPR